LVANHVFKLVKGEPHQQLIIAAAAAAAAADNNNAWLLTAGDRVT